MPNDTIIRFVVYKKNGLNDIEFVDSYILIKSAIRRVLELNNGCRRPKYFYTKEIRRNEKLF